MYKNVCIHGTVIYACALPPRLAAEKEPEQEQEQAAAPRRCSCFSLLLFVVCIFGSTAI